VKALATSFAVAAALGAAPSAQAPAASGSEIIVADTVDGSPLSDTQGPLRMVVPRDKRGERSVRMLQRLEVVRPPGNAPAPKPH